MAVIENGYFKLSDDTALKIEGYEVNQSWWSRRYEYPWALQYAGDGMRVADMGCGWTPRPFKDALAKICGHVYAVDGNEKVLTQPGRERMEFVVADLTERIEQIPEGSLDRVFCISVLEDVGDKVPPAGESGTSLALAEFARCLKVGGLCVLTFDVQYDYGKPLGQYPGVIIDKFWLAALDAGLWLMDDPDMERVGLVVHEDFNLCVFHCVLVKHDE